MEGMERKGMGRKHQRQDEYLPNACRHMSILYSRLKLPLAKGQVWKKKEPQRKMGKKTEKKRDITQKERGWIEREIKGEHILAGSPTNSTKSTVLASQVW